MKGFIEPRPDHLVTLGTVDEAAQTKPLAAGGAGTDLGTVLLTARTPDRTTGTDQDRLPFCRMDMVDA